MTAFELHLTSYDALVDQVRELADKAATAYLTATPTVDLHHDGLNAAVRQFLNRWDYAMGKHAQDVLDYAPRLSLTRKAYVQTDELLAEDIKAAWNGEY